MTAKSFKLYGIIDASLVIDTSNVKYRKNVNINMFPEYSFSINVLCLSQTWENPEVLDEATGFKGDNDPIDVLEIGYRVR